MINQVGIDVQSGGIIIHKTSAVGPSEFTDTELRRQVGEETLLDLEQAFREPIPYVIRDAPLEPWECILKPTTRGGTKRNKSKLKQQRLSRRRNR